jgi:hypothetical protein
MKHFALNLDADPNGTAVKEHIKANYGLLVDLFGAPLKEEGDKISHAWVFENRRGGIVTLYSWCIVRQPFSGYGVMSRQDFENLPTYNWSIGATNYKDAAEFLWWLNVQIDKHKIKNIFKRRALA